MNTNASIILPALDERDCLEELLKELHGYHKIIANEVGLGYAIGEALGRILGTDVIVMDADGNHPARYVPKMLHLLETHDLVCCCRAYHELSPKGLLSWICNALIHRLLKIPVTDCTSGFFACKTSLLRALPKSVWTGYGDFYIELLHHATKNGWSIAEVPVVYDPRIIGNSSTRLVKHSVQYLVRILRCIR